MPTLGGHLFSHYILRLIATESFSLIENQKCYENYTQEYNHSLQTLSVLKCNENYTQEYNHSLQTLSFLECY
jgi:hypothetical protein